MTKTANQTWDGRDIEHERRDKKRIQNVRKSEGKITLNIARIEETVYEEVNTFKLVYSVNVEKDQLRQMISD